MLAALEKAAAQLRSEASVLFRRALPNIPLTPAAWRQRDLPADDLLLGSLFSSNSRLQLSADTGVGKTMIGLAFAFSIGLGRDFLHRRSHRPGRVLYVDGEMPPGEVQKRLAAAASWFDLQPEEVPDDGLWILNHEDVPHMAPLDTEGGQRWLFDFIDQLGVVDFIIFDNISALTAASLKEEDGAQLLKDFQPALTARRVGQLWLHHTGHDATRGYGSKLREWALDVAMVAEKVDRPGTDVAFNLTFPKARRRTPENRADFEPVLIELREGPWNGSIPKQKPRRLAPRAEMCRQALEKAVAEHGTKPPTSSGTNGVSLAVRVETWRDYFDRMAPYEEDEKGKAAKREAWRWGKEKLYAEKVISTWGRWAWLT
jgi:AAA domain